MSIEANYRRITPKDFAALENDPEAAGRFFGTSLECLDNPEELLAKMQDQQTNGKYFSLGNDWHALHFLLTGDGELESQGPVNSPLHEAVQGGSPTIFECTYGQVRSLNPEKVREVANVLSSISVDDLRTKFNAEAFNAAKIYPHGRRGEWTADEAESLFMIFPDFVQFFQSAAAAGDMVLLSSD